MKKTPEGPIRPAPTAPLYRIVIRGRASSPVWVACINKTFEFTLHESDAHEFENIRQVKRLLTTRQNRQLTTLWDLAYVEDHLGNPI